MPTASPCSLQALIRHTTELAGGKCRSPTVSVAGGKSLWRANGVTAADCCACGRSDRHPVQWIGEGASAGVVSGRGGRGGWSTGDAAAAVPDLERTIAKEYGYDFYRAAGLLAHAYALTGEKQRAEALFREVTDKSVASETYLNFAELLASEGRNAEARAWAQKVLDKKPAMPGYQKRRERPWFRSASRMLKRLPA